MVEPWVVTRKMADPAQARLAGWFACAFGDGVVQAKWKGAEVSLRMQQQQPLRDPLWDSLLALQPTLPGTHTSSFACSWASVRGVESAPRSGRPAVEDPPALYLLILPAPDLERADMERHRSQHATRRGRLLFLDGVVMVRDTEAALAALRERVVASVP